jgi:EAL domain-containing protein (putative c-di-GMP-specific phosphodiesterase class I)/GGDEF domain-containing protein
MSTEIQRRQQAAPDSAADKRVLDFVSRLVCLAAVLASGFAAGLQAAPLRATEQIPASQSAPYAHGNILGRETFGLELSGARQLRASPIERFMTGSLLRRLLAALFAGACATATWILFERPRQGPPALQSLHRRLGKLNESLIDALRQKEAAEARTFVLTYQDASTGVLNRFALEQALDRELATARGTPAERLVVLVIRFTSMGEVVSAYGHGEANSVLREAAARVRASQLPVNLHPQSIACPPASLQWTDSSEFGQPLLARIGDADLALVMRVAADSKPAAALTEHFSQALAEPYRAANVDAYVSTAFGIAIQQSGLVRASELIDQAVLAAHDAAQGAPCTCTVFEPEARAAAATRVQLETDIRHALNRGEFVLHYHPIVALEDGQLRGFEALIRWRHPREGLLAPARFLPAAESAGLMLDIDRVVLRQAALQARQWALEFDSDFFISLNLSPQHFTRPEIAADIGQLLEDCRVPPHHLRIEITENALINDIEAASRVAAELRERGINICLDDFGTGYSSLNYLRALPLDGLKIDRSFVERMAFDARDFAVVKTIVDLAHYLQLYCVVEGVETAEHRELLEVIGADYIQGDLISRAVPREQAEQMLRAPVFARRVA